MSDNDGTRWSRVLRGMEQTEPVTEWDQDFRDSHVQMRMRGAPEPDLPIVPNVIPTSQVTVSGHLDGTIRVAPKCEVCHQPAVGRVTNGRGYNAVRCEDCSDPRDLKYVAKPKGRPRKTT